MRHVRDKMLGVVFGTAIGDALGYPVEFLSLDEIRMRYPEGLTDFPPKPKTPLYSDDTQMLIATLQGLLDANTTTDLNLAAVAIAKRYVEWSKSPENNRAPGMACMAGCRALDRGVSWRLAGSESSTGCGTAMRSMAYGMWFWNNPTEAARWAYEHARMTHRTIEAMEAAAAVAAAVATAFLTPVAKPLDIFGAVAEQFQHQPLQLVKWAYKSAFLADVAPDDCGAEAVLNRLRGWTAAEAVAGALYCFARAPDNYRAAVSLAVNSPGDSDSLGAITGALSGAYLGIDAIPAHMVKRVENSAMLRRLAEQVCAARLDKASATTAQA